MADDETILLCGAKKDFRGPWLEGTVEDICAECGEVILRNPDPGVPEDAVHLCMGCGFARIAASDEVPEFKITEQNKELLDRLGYKLRVDGSC